MDRQLPQAKPIMVTTNQILCTHPDLSLAIDSKLLPAKVKAEISLAWRN
jgi:hypothetical protein